MVESDGVNNTLAASKTCPNANKADIGGLGNTLAEKWIVKYLETATKRLAPMIEGVNLTRSDVFEMQLTCAYEVSRSMELAIARLRNSQCMKMVSLGFSKFCELFTEEEWKGFEYAIVREFR